MATTAEISDDPVPSIPLPAPQARLVLQPGQLSKPEKVWSSSSALIIGFYQAAPYSEAFKIFYKKSGAVFGTQVMLTPASILGPELAVRQSLQGDAQYFEYEIKKLKPSTQYVVKIKTSDDSSEVRTDKLVTVSQEEERTRDNDMRNFVGALVKLGDYDGLVVSYAPSSGIYGIRILQIDDVASSLQLARINSDYTDNGLPVQAYTLSQVRFGRWGGAIAGSKVVNEGELKWLVARAVQMGDKSDAAAAFEARQRMLQAQVERVTMTLELEWSNRFRSLRIRSLTLLALLALVAVAAGAGMGLMLAAAEHRQRDLELQLAANGVRQADLEAELQILHLYRVSLELDVERRIALSDSGRGNGSSTSKSHSDGNSKHESYGNSTGSCGGGGGRFLDVYLAATADRNGTAGGGGNDGGGEQRKSDGVAADAAAAVEAARKRKGGKGNGRRAGDRTGGGTAAVPSAKVSRGSQQPLPTRLKTGRSGGGGGGDVRSSRGNSRRGDLSSDRGGGGGGGRTPSQSSAVSRDRSSSAAATAAAAELWGLPNEALSAALERSRLARSSSHKAEDRRAGSWKPKWLPNTGASGDSGGHRRQRAAEHYNSETTTAEYDNEDEPQPDAWTFIHYVSHVYALHLQEWMRVQLQKSVRRRVNEMLLPSRTDDDVAAVSTKGRNGDSTAAAAAATAAGSNEGADAQGYGKSDDVIPSATVRMSEGDDDEYDGDNTAAECDEHQYD